MRLPVLRVEGVFKAAKVASIFFRAVDLTRLKPLNFNRLSIA